MHDNFFKESLRQSIGMRVFLFLFILLISTLIGIALSAIFVYAGDIGIKIGQGINSIFMFIVPPIVYYYLTRKEHRMQELGFRSLTPPRWLMLIGVALMFVSLPVTNQLTTWNEGMSFGKGLIWLEDWIKTLEETAKVATEKMLNVDTIGGLLLNMVVVALIPALGEEMTFRGVLQQSLTRKMSPHMAILLSAAIFSFIHFQFYGFLPRMFLGILLGYMFYITGSLWTSILMHFLNNGTAVMLYYLNNIGVINIDVEHFGAMHNVWLIAMSAMFVAGIIFYCWQQRRCRNLLVALCNCDGDHCSWHKS